MFWSDKNWVITDKMSENVKNGHFHGFWLKFPDLFKFFRFRPPNTRPGSVSAAPQSKRPKYGVISTSCPPSNKQPSAGFVGRRSRRRTRGTVIFGWKTMISYAYFVENLIFFWENRIFFLKISFWDQSSGEGGLGKQENTGTPWRNYLLKVSSEDTLGILNTWGILENSRFLKILKNL